MRPKDHSSIIRIGTVAFPRDGQDHDVNMMPIIAGDIDSVPRELRGYAPMIDVCQFEAGSTVYLTVNSSHVQRGGRQRRGGIHVECPRGMLGWGGGWGGARRNAGIYMASTDGGTRVWDTMVEPEGDHGQVPRPSCPHVDMDPSTLYWMTDRTPHEARPSLESGRRTFFRLVSSKIGGWFVRHNTPNPLGVKPMAPMIYEDKFA